MLLTDEEYTVAAENGISRQRAYQRVLYGNWSIEKSITKPLTGGEDKREYAVYKGDELLVMGTAKECGEYLNISPKTIRFYSFPSYAKRIEKRKNSDNAIISVLIDDIEEDE